MMFRTGQCAVPPCEWFSQRARYIHLPQQVYALHFTVHDYSKRALLCTSLDSMSPTGQWHAPLSVLFLQRAIWPWTIACVIASTEQCSVHPSVHRPQPHCPVIPSVWCWSTVTAMYLLQYHVPNGQCHHIPPALSCSQRQRHLPPLV